VAVDLGGGINVDIGSSVALAAGDGVGSIPLGDLAAGAAKPYSVSIPIGDRSLASNPKHLVAPHWDVATLEASELVFEITNSGSHVIDNVSGKVKNTGKGPATNAVITFAESAGKGGSGVLGSTTAKVGDVPAGGATPFQLAVDLGADPPQDVYYSSTFTYDSARVASEQETTHRVGGTLTVTGFLRNSGAVSALGLVLGVGLLDGTGAKLVSASSR